MSCMCALYKMTPPSILVLVPHWWWHIYSSSRNVFGETSKSFICIVFYDSTVIRKGLWTPDFQFKVGMYANTELQVSF